MFLKKLVKQRNYLTEEEFIELNALCQILPGPTSTQTMTAIGFKMGGPLLAYLTLFIWVLPSVVLMTLAAILINHFEYTSYGFKYGRFIEPMAVAFVAYAAWVISSKVVYTRVGIVLMIVSAILGFFLRSPYVPPVLLILGGFATLYKFRQHPQHPVEPIRIVWANFVLFIAVLVFAALLGHFTDYKPVRLFENFYRNGSLIFGGGQVLVPLLYNEFVLFKMYLNSQEFLAGYALVQAMPGPVFAIASYIGALSMRTEGISGEILGSIAATAGIFLPGTFLIFFVYRIWGQLKKYRFVKASLEGINAVSSGLVTAAAISMFEPVHITFFNVFIMIVTFAMLLSEKIPAPIVILLGLLVSFFF